jgi:hyperosmotically inducible periplasmic protein
MNRRYLPIIALAGVFAFSVPAMAGDESSSNGATAETGARDIYHGAKGGLKDTAITSKIKADLLTDKQTRHYSIHVDTHGNGIVELRGDVPSRAVARHAVEIAENVSGVRSVRNELNVRGSSRDSDD